MAAVQETRDFSTLDADQAYQAADLAFQQAGFTVWKRRPLGWIVLAKLEKADLVVNANAACRPGNKSSITLSLDSTTAAEADLKALSDSLFELINPGS